MKKKPVLHLKLNKGDISVDGIEQKMTLPKGCLGVMLVFESNASAMRWDSDAKTIKIRQED